MQKDDIGWYRTQEEIQTATNIGMLEWPQPCQSCGITLENEEKVYFKPTKQKENIARFNSEAPVLCRKCQRKETVKNSL